MRTATQAPRWIATVLVSLLALAAVPLAGASGASASGSMPAIGTVPDLTWGISRSDMTRTVDLMVAAGVRWVRLNVSWSGVERDGKGVINEGWLAELDAAVSIARNAGLEVLMPIADGVPYWASADPTKSGGQWDVMWRPVDMDDYGDFVEFVVRRYRPMGVRHFEIWNEPNHRWFWPSGVDAGEYVEMLRAGHAAVKRASADALVVLGGLTKSDYRYLEALYAAGAQPYFDIAAIHPYVGAVDPRWCWQDGGRNAIDAFCAIDEVYGVMAANGDASKPLWLTEFGWTSYNGEWGVSEAQQAEYLAAALEYVSARPYVTHAFWYSFRNVSWYGDDPNEWHAQTGLLRTDFSPKPAYEALRSLGAGPTPPPTTTTTAPPPTTTTTAVVPTTTTTAAAPAGITLDATSAKVRGRYEVELRWTGATGGFVAVERSSQGLTLTETVANTGSHTLRLRRGTYDFRVCEPDATTCSPVVRVRL